MDNKQNTVDFTLWVITNFTFASVDLDDKVHWRSSILQKYYNEPNVKTIFTTEEMYDLFTSGVKTQRVKPKYRMMRCA